MPAHDAKNEELYQIAGDPSHGMASTMNLTQTAIGRPHVRYKDRVLEIDVYRLDGRLMLHLICPRCLNALRITEERKRMDFDERSGVLSVEPFGCTWNTDDRKQDFGVGLCMWRVGIERNVARDH